MRSEDDIVKRLVTIRAYYEAGWFEDPSHAAFGASELLWARGFEEGSGLPYLNHADIYHEGRGEYVHE